MDENLPARADAPAPSLAFTPVPRSLERGDTWTPDVQRAFIEYLADLGSVTEACRLVGRSTTGAYRLKRHPEAGEFAAAWAAALRIAIGMVEDNAIDRAINGVEVPVFAYGKSLATRRVFNDRLVMFMLRNHAPERYCEGGARAMSAVDKRLIERLKRDWRKEWEREAGARQLEQEVITIESINAKIDKMAERTRRHESPRVRAAREAYEEAMALDREEGYSPYRDPGHELYIPRLAARPPEGEEAGTVFNGPIASSEPEDASEADEPPKGPRIRTIKDDGW